MSVCFSKDFDKVTLSYIVYVDASQDCNDLVFQLGQSAGGTGSTAAARQWNIKVSFLLCGYLSENIIIYTKLY